MLPSDSIHPVEIIWCIGEVSQQRINLTDTDVSWLSLSEKRLVSGMRFSKRRSEWLSGRWVAKQLLVRGLPCLAHKWMGDISIENHPKGYPLVQMDGEPLQGCLSISHRQNKAAAAYTAERGVFIGIDLEWIESRHPAFLQDYFTNFEVNWVQTASSEEQAIRTTLLWSAKEAALKALQIGLAVDTRQIEVHPCFEEEVSNWGTLEYFAAFLEEGGGLRGWWYSHDNYVITLAVYFPASVNPTFSLNEIRLSD